MTQTVYLSGLKYTFCELTQVLSNRGGCLKFLYASMKPTFQTETRTTWINNAHQSTHLGLQSLWCPRVSTTRDSLNLHQTNSMHQANLFHLLITHRQGSCLKSNQHTEYDDLTNHCCYRSSEPDILKFDRSQLRGTLNHAQKIMKTSRPPIPTQIPFSTPPPPSSRFKPPRMEIPWWSGKNYEFYSWLSAYSRSLETTKCPEAPRTQMMFQALPLDKTPPFNNISDWVIFKKKLISKFGGIPYLCVWSKHSLQPHTCLRIRSRTC